MHRTKSLNEFITLSNTYKIREIRLHRLDLNMLLFLLLSYFNLSKLYIHNKHTMFSIFLRCLFIVYMFTCPSLQAARGA